MFFPSFSAARTTLENPIPVRRTNRLLRATGMVLGMVLLALAPSYVQKGGQAGIQGTVTDNTGAVIPDAAVTATNNATGAASVRQTSSASLYSISPILPGTYTVVVTAKGF